MSNGLKILYYFEPWIELSRPHLRYHNLRYQMGPQIRDIRKNYPGIEIKIALGEGTFHKCQVDRYDLEGCDYVLLKQDELRRLGQNYLSTSTGLFDQDPEICGPYAQYLLDKFDSWRPDIVISFLAPLPDLSGVWPGVSTVFAEFGMFSRAPYPRTFYFDTEGMFRNSTVNRFAAELMEAVASEDAIDLLRDFRQNYLFPFYKHRPILDEELVTAAGRYECKLLLPLQFSAYFGFDCCAPYADQFEFLTDVLDSIPQEIGVFVTEHAGWPEVITEHNIGFLRDRYPNLLWSPHLSKIRAASQYLMTEVDGVITVSSSVGMQCMAWDKPLYSPWNSHLSGFSQVRCLNDISLEKVSDYQPGTYDNAVIELLCRYYLTEELAYDSKRFLSYIKECLARKESKSLSGRLPALGTPREIFKSLRDAYRESEGQALYVQDIGGAKEKIRQSVCALVPEDYKRQLEHVDVVSFDLFDTLVDRPFFAPHQVFLYMQDEVRELVADRSLEFHKLRRYAEHRARQESDNNEVTIEEIYDVFFMVSGVNEVFKSALIELEFETEMRFCRRRESGYALYDYAVGNGKYIIVVSDFYYGEKYLRGLVENVGYSNIGTMFVSADYCESKKEGGLFRKVCKAASLNPGKTLHVGDNYSSDIENAKKYGYKTHFTPRSMDRLKDQPVARGIWHSLLGRAVFSSERAELAQGVFFGLVAKRWFDYRVDRPHVSFGHGDPTKLGYLVLGPLIFGFTQWLIGQLKQNEHSQVFFLSRDGRLFNRAYDIFRQVDCDLPKPTYLLSSRRAYGLAAVREVADAQELIAIPFEPTSVKSIFESRFSVALDEETCGQELRDAGFLSVSSKVHPVHDLIRLKRLVALVWPLIEQQAAREREGLKKYFSTVGIDGGERIAVVDIGYAGTIQHYLAKLINAPRLSGYYFMTHAKAEEYRRSGVNISAYYREHVEHNLKKDLLSNNISLFELFFSSEEPSLIGFEVGNDGSLIHNTKPCENAKNRSQLVQLIQRGALQFVSDVLDCVGGEHGRLYFSRDFAVHHLERLITEPAREDALLFNNVAAEDSFSARNARFIVADVVSALAQRNGRLTKDEARSLVERSDWKAGARAILPAPARKNMQHAAVAAKPRRVPTVLDRPIRLYKKLRRDPYQYFADSKIPPVRKLKRFFQ